jgi:hypothetical protein
MEMVKAALSVNDHGPALLFVADGAALTLPDHPVLAVDLLDDRRPFWCIPSEL